MTRTTLLNCRIDGDDKQHDLHLADGVIAEIVPSTGADPGLPADEVVDVAGKIVLPSFVDGHCHADKSLWGEPWSRRDSVEISMDQMFEDTLRQWAEVSTPVHTRAGAFMRECVAHGSTHLRAFADVDPAIGLEGVHAMLALKQELAAAADIEVVAFPQLGLLRRPGNDALLEEALREGADAVGGLDPAGVDGDAGKVLDTVFGLADKHGAKVDFHMHEEGELGLWLMKQIAQRTVALGMQGKVTLCDVFSLAYLDREATKAAGTVLAEAGITVAVGVHGLLPVPDVLTLHEVGVGMCLGSDSSRSQWSPWGDGDMLSRATFLAYKSYFRRDVDLEFALSLTNRLGRAGLGLAANEVRVGDPADLVVLPGQALGEIVVSPPSGRLVLKAGAVVARDGVLVD
ncbi:amidohydrolase family protein [Nocardioides albidus]|uniref:Amidohydrolase family protein n=1 Tax=Nocardioides albidus TaxID=1517589 RepID=A0A5C4VKW0_9ACTN|nr:amidohydrolase family protein [Nocardioides albidus]TNM36483.1 amidohydrolase family protein [Nocardioides albidus]